VFVFKGLLTAAVDDKVDAIAKYLLTQGMNFDIQVKMQ
jgi:hypothetical protein